MRPIQTDAEETKLRQVIQTNWASHLPEFELGLSTGLRKGSQYALTWEMVDWEGRMLNIPTSKNGERLHIPLNAAALAALKLVYQMATALAGSFSPPRQATRWRTGGHWFAQAVEKAGIADFHGHDLRPTFATRLRMKCTALEDIADLLGHKSLTLRKRYSHLGPNKLHEVVSCLDSANSTPAAPEPASASSAPSRYVN